LVEVGEVVELGELGEVGKLVESMLHPDRRDYARQEVAGPVLRLRLPSTFHFAGQVAGQAGSG